MPTYLPLSLKTGPLAALSLIVCTLAVAPEAHAADYICKQEWVVDRVGPDATPGRRICIREPVKTKVHVVEAAQPQVNVIIHNQVPESLAVAPSTALITDTATVIPPQNRYAYIWNPYTVAELTLYCGFNTAQATKVATHYGYYTWWERWRVDTYRYWGSHLRACRLLGPPALQF